MAEPLTGKLLVASPALLDGNFVRTVIYLCAHSEQGAIGVVLNRPLGLAPVMDHLPAWAPFVAEPPVFFQGGPVEQSTAVALARALDMPDEEAWTLVNGNVGVVDLGREPGTLGLAALRIFSGYSGWSAGQLEGEIEQEAWFVVDASRGDLFTANPAALWHDVLRRQRGDLAIYADFPREPGMN